MQGALALHMWLPSATEEHFTATSSGLLRIVNLEGRVWVRVLAAHEIKLK